VKITIVEEDGVKRIYIDDLEIELRKARKRAVEVRARSVLKSERIKKCMEALREAFGGMSLTTSEAYHFLEYRGLLSGSRDKVAYVYSVLSKMVQEGMADLLEARKGKKGGNKWYIRR